MARIRAQVVALPHSFPCKVIGRRMPIRFACPRCHRKLKARRSAVGMIVNCPGCGEGITIPGEAAVPRSMRNAVQAAETDPVDEGAYGQFVVYGDDEVDFETGEVIRASEESADDHVVVPRAVVYVQGALLGTMTIVGFVLGLLCGVSLDQPASDYQSANRGVFGTVTYVARMGRPQPDIGAVILLLPVDILPDEKIRPASLRPDQPPPQANDPSLGRIAALGGRFIRADEAGRYRFTNVQPGRYFILYLSGSAKRPSGETAASADLAELGRYFFTPTELLGNGNYRWQSRRISGEHQWDVHFGEVIASR